MVAVRSGRVHTALTALLTALCGVHLVAVWRGDVGVQLRPAGLVDRSPLGTLTVPWEALAPGDRHRAGYDRLLCALPGPAAPARQF